MGWQLSHAVPGRQLSSPTAAGQSGMVARVLPFCASSPLPARGARAATRARWQTARTTLSATDASHGSGKNEPTMDSQGGALLPVAASFRLRGSQARYGRNSVPWGGRGTCEQKASDGAFFQEKKACLDCTLMKKGPEGILQKAGRILHHIPWLHLTCSFPHASAGAQQDAILKGVKRKACRPSCFMSMRKTQA
jgi:hypothetical protein